MTQFAQKSKPEPRRWFRFYAESIDDPKVQKLAPHLFKTWVNLLSLACQNGGVLPSRGDIAFRLRMSDHDAQCHIDDLILHGLIDVVAAGKLEPHNWKGRQFLSDSSAERVRKHRKQKQETACNVTCNDAVAPPDTETDTETEKETSLIAPPPPAEPIVEPQAARPKSKPRGSRLDPEWELPDDWRQWALTIFPGANVDQIDDQAARFRDYWVAKPGAQARKLDWEATWRNWCRQGLSAAGTVRRPQSTGVFRDNPMPSISEAIAKLVAEEAAHAAS